MTDVRHQRTARRRDRMDEADGSLGIGLGGISGGAGIVAIAQQIGLNTLPGRILIYLAPAMAVAMGWLLRELNQWVAWRKGAAPIRRAAKTLRKQLLDPHISQEQKAKIREMLDELSRIEVTAAIELVRDLRGSPGDADNEEGDSS